MGKLGRFACIFVPMALSIASLICLALVFSGQLDKGNSLQRELFFFKADTRQFNANPVKLPNENYDNTLFDALKGAASSKDLKDFYTVGLWNYCEGDTDKDGKNPVVTYCSPRKTSYWFNPIEVWDLKNTTAQKIFGDKMQKGLNDYKKVTGWMFAAYVIAFWVTVAEIVLGIFAIFSRWGSFVTTIASSVSTFFIFGAAITSTTIYAALAGTFDSVLKPYEIHASMSKQMLGVVWLAVAFSFASGLFWLFSTCCCSGKSKNKKVTVEKTPYTYERVASPYLGARAQGGEDTLPLNPMPHAGAPTGAYEPFRQQHV
ncbi:integral membrane protein-like protein [Mytilinidion resinicola]|uniref:Integral membrane protein-like protein n=1 Tax=Mytilinidion resinicola TaxID=574789 RepID=A0A6A6Z3X7_9PEZI|nr:integral membrane protein-like protein [Mytilinidion resinicola]KAF2814865.1 integral membrane protein-like protein [Mytilinidion resinicola]